MGGDQADRMNAGRSSFDEAKDPPFNANTHFAAGQLAESQSNPEKAIAQYAKALQLDPRLSAALYRQAIVYTQLRRFDEAIDAWTRYIQLTDQSPAGYSNLGFCLELAGRPQQAEEAYRKGIARDAHHQACRVNYGLMLARLGRVNEAITQLQTVLSEAEVHYNLASVFEQQGRKESAKVEYRKALASDPNLFDAHQRLAQLGDGDQQ